jgi:FkbM family methyltransferase
MNLDTIDYLGWTLPKNDEFIKRHLQTFPKNNNQDKIVSFANNLNFKKDLVIDAGANIGTKALQFVNTFKNVVCFEPVKINFHCLTENCKNYTNICYLDDTIKNYYIPESEKFLIALDNFMYRIDQINLRYINEIEWDTNENVNCKETERLLKLSYFEKDVILKLDYCVQAYKILIIIVEIIRKEKYKFKDTHLFETKGFKRRKL